MLTERLNPERFSGVMTSEKKINAQLLGRDCRPMRRFASNKGFDSFPGDPLNFATTSTRDHADMPCNSRSGSDFSHRSTHCFFQPSRDFFYRKVNQRPLAQERALLLKERVGVFDS